MSSTPPSWTSSAQPAGEPAVEAVRRSYANRLVSILGIVGLVLVIVVAGLLLLSAIAGSTGDTGFAVGLALASLPVLPLVAAFVWLDRFEPEPPLHLVVLFLWGATVAAFAAAVLNQLGSDVLSQALSGAGTAEAAIFIAPWVEELAKGSVILVIATFKRHEFNGVVDGLVAAGMVGIGFAFSENVLYFGRAFLTASTEHGPEAGVVAAGVTFVIRGVLSPFAHPLFTAATGIGLGIAVGTRLPWLRIAAPIGGFLVAVLLHSLWNASAVAGLIGFLTGYVLLMLPLLIGAIALATWSRRLEGHLIARQLPAYVADGWLPAYDVPMLASMHQRRLALAWIKSVAGGQGVRNLRAYQHVATELAFLRDRVARGFTIDDAAQRERGLLDDLYRLRGTLPNPPGGSWEPPFTMPLMQHRQDTGDD
jgi:RsiW-degrading membrane proteinase PrsW (M82 family)